jgi:hypothetical protein
MKALWAFMACSRANIYLFTFKNRAEYCWFFTDDTAYRNNYLCLHNRSAKKLVRYRTNKWCRPTEEKDKRL